MEDDSSSGEIVHDQSWSKRWYNSPTVEFHHRLDAKYIWVRKWC